MHTHLEQGPDVNRRRLILAGTTVATLGAFAACSDKTPASAAAPAAASAAAAVSPRQTYELAAQGTGFNFGPMLAANTVVVFFDTSCPHCAALWMNSKPLLNRLKMVWMPIGLLRSASVPQGATILSAPDPAAAMNENEASVLAHGGGISAGANLPDELLAKVKANTELFNKLGADSVPFIVYRHAKSGEYGSHAGAVSTEDLAAMVGL
jgi:thiol:disulfide interchange protein DsbG